VEQSSKDFAGLKSLISSRWTALPIFLLAWGLMVLSLYNQFQIYVYFILGFACFFEWSRKSFKINFFLFMLFVGLFGWALESLESHFGILKIMGENPQPLWLILLWPYYASVTFDLFTSYVDRYWKAFLYGASSLPGAYYLVARIDIAEIGVSAPLFFLINGTVGGIVLMFACLMYYSLKLDKL
jgi:hypothetical protein